MPKPSYLLVLLAAAVGCAANRSRWDARPEARAVEFLKREVPAWSKENGCFSCHNNGDAARALYQATRLGYQIPRNVLADTTAWLARPNQWEENKGEPGFSDQRLANVQFAAALLAAYDAGHVRERKALVEAAQKVAADQEADGAWHVEPGNTVGSPATYGTTLATQVAWQTLNRVHAPGTGETIGKAENWLRQAQPNNVLAAATLLLASGRETVPSQPQALDLNPSRIEECLDLIRRAQTRDGGWGPYADSPPEPFDTSVVLLSLAGLRHRDGVREMVGRGRNFLGAQQREDGSWPATTRPPGGQSYAQRISTTGWATLALLATGDKATIPPR